MIGHRRVVGTSWPRIEWESLPWEAEPEQGASRRARLRARGPYQAAIPAFIADVPMPDLPDGVAVDCEDAAIELARFDASTGPVVAPFGAILLRTESSASSEIERLTASAKNIALAEIGRRSAPNSRLIVGNARALEAAVDLADDLDAAAIIRMQREILVDTAPEPVPIRAVGGWRTEAVWIGGGFGGGPHGADYVAPHADRVPALMDDLIAFCRRTDLPALVQIAIAHAQFETIHPFPDGNGRTGRALIQALLRRLGVTQNLTVPVSAGLMLDTASYFEALTAYHRGDVTPIIRAVGQAAFAAMANGRTLVADLVRVRSRWDDAVTSRAGSVGRRALDVLQRQPVVDARILADALDVDPKTAQNGIDRLVADGVLAQIGSGARNRLYEAFDVLAALDAFAERARRG